MIPCLQSKKHKYITIDVVDTWRTPFSLQAFSISYSFSVSRSAFQFILTIRNLISCLEIIFGRENSEVIASGLNKQANKSYYYQLSRSVKTSKLWSSLMLDHSHKLICTSTAYMHTWYRLWCSLLARTWKFFTSLWILSFSSFDDMWNLWMFILILANLNKRWNFSSCNAQMSKCKHPLDS
jgi:hypothetical protein